MQLNLDWMSPIALCDGSDENLIYTCGREQLPDGPGIYIFGRQHGQSFEALYVGKARSVHNRVRQQFKNLPLMRHVENTKTGERVLLIAKFKGLSEQQPDNCLPIIESALIRHYLERGDDIVNNHGTHLRTHEIISSGAGHRHGIPSTIVVDAD